MNNGEKIQYDKLKQGGWVEMLIFQLHLPHVIPNSMQALHALNHSGGSVSISTYKFDAIAEEDKTEDCPHIPKG